MKLLVQLALFGAVAVQFVNAQSSVFGSSPIVNPRAEYGPGGGYAQVTAVPGWSRTGGCDVYAYNTAYNNTNAISPQDIVPAISQCVTSASDYALSGWLRGFALPVTVHDTEPGLRAPANFVVNGNAYLAAMFPDGRTYVFPAGMIPGVPSRPASPGETIIIYGNGFGGVNPDIPAGQMVQQANALNLPLQISFGTMPATVTYAGLAQNHVGMYEFDVGVPDVEDSDLVPVTFTLNGVSGSQVLFTAVNN